MNHDRSFDSDIPEGEESEGALPPLPALTTMVADRICNLIREKQLNVLDRIPTELDLSRLFHVGRGTVREAVKLLVSKNILEIRRGTGTFVCEKKGVVDDPFGFSYAEDKTHLIADLVTVRMILEPQIAFLAAQFVTSEEIVHMREKARLIDDLAAAKQDFYAEDIIFHTLIAQSSRNTVMPNLIPVIHYGIEWYNRGLKEYEHKKALSYHTEIVNALERHDPDMAKSAMQMHLSYNRHNVENTLQSQI